MTEITQRLWEHYVAFRDRIETLGRQDNLSESEKDEIYQLRKIVDLFQYKWDRDTLEVRYEYSLERFREHEGKEPSAAFAYSKETLQAWLEDEKRFA